jgi:hypothetical protein
MLATRGSARWQHFDWAVTADAFQTLYRQLAEENQ